MGYTIQEEKGFKFLDTGKGENLLLLHGLFGALSNFGKLIDHFKERYRVIVPILPLYSLAVHETTVKGLVKYVRKFVEHKGYERLHLVGNSLGGHVGLVYSLNQMEKIASLTLTGSSGLFENSLGDTFPKRGSYEYVKEKTELTFYDPNVATKELIDQVYNIVNDNKKAIRILYMARSALRHNLRNKIHKLKMPTLLIWGKDDTITPPFVGEEFEKLMPNARLILMEKCGHAPMMEKPEEFNSHLDNFLQKVIE